MSIDECSAHGLIYIICRVDVDRGRGKGVGGGGGGGGGDGGGQCTRVLGFYTYQSLRPTIFAQELFFVFFCQGGCGLISQCGSSCAHY